MEGHICRQNTLMFALVFCFEQRARAARACCHCHLAVKNPIHDGKRGQLKLPKSHERYHNVVMWHWFVYKWRRSKQMLSFHRTFLLTDRQICEDQIVTLKQSHILLCQGLLFLTRSTCVIVDARSHTCKSHDFIPRYDIIYINFFVLTILLALICWQ